jgi:hypothetical protein
MPGNAETATLLLSLANLQAFEPYPCTGGQVPPEKLRHILPLPH